MQMFAAPSACASRSVGLARRPRQPFWHGEFLAVAMTFAVVSIAGAQEVPEQKTANQIYFETMGSLIPAAPGGEPTFPRTWELSHGRTLKFRGRIDTDSIWSVQSMASQVIVGNLGSVVGLRRARVGAEGDLQQQGRYIGEIDLAGGEVAPRDVFLGYGEKNEGGERRYGHYREPFSLEGGTSANYFAFMERSPINTLDPARSWGISRFACNADETATFAIGFFHDGSDRSNLEAGEGASAALTAKVTAAPLLVGDGEQLLHFGAVVSERLPTNDVVIVNPTPAAPLLDLGDSSASAFVPELRIPAGFQQLFNLQFAWVNGPAWAQSEWYGTLIPRIGGDLVFIHGFYVSWGYFITGERRVYESQSGVFGPIHVARPFCYGPAVRGRPLGWGAWELTARFSYEDYADPDLQQDSDSDFTGVRLPQATFGVNWYWTDRLRFLFNYSYLVPDELAFGKSEASIIAMRLNVYW